MALRARKVSGAFEKRTPGFEPCQLTLELHALTMGPLCLPHVLDCTFCGNYSHGVLVDLLSSVIFMGNQMTTSESRI